MRKRTRNNAATVRKEVVMGKRIWDSRGRRSEITGAVLGPDYDHVFCSHVLGKGSAPAFRLYTKNIVLMSFEEHRLWEHYRHQLKSDPKWDWVFQLQELLKQEQARYYRTGFFRPWTE